MAFHHRYWDQPVKNTSMGYNYYEWNQKYRGGHVGQFLKEDPRPLQKPIQPIDLDPQIRLIVPPGGIILFSGAQLHSSVSNISGKTRFSTDFRRVHLDDVKKKKGAPIVDEACMGTTVRDYLRGRDLTRIPEDLVALYDDGTSTVGELLYQPK